MLLNKFNQCLSHTKVAKFRKDMLDCSNGPMHVNCIEKVDTHIDECWKLLLLLIHVTWKLGISEIE